MKKNAFTLIELIGVVVILAAIALLAFPPLINQIKKSQNELDEATEQLVINSAKLYVDNSNQFEGIDGNIYCTSFNDLINSGYLTEGMISGNEDLLTNMTVKISYSNGYSYDIVPINQCEPRIIKQVCKLVDDADDSNSITVGDKYSCDTGDGVYRTFYILQKNESNVSLIMNENISGPYKWHNDSLTVTLTNLQNGLKNSTSEWVNVEVTLPTAKQLYNVNNSENILSTPWLYENLLGEDVMCYATSDTCVDGENLAGVGDCNYEYGPAGDRLFAVCDIRSDETDWEDLIALGAFSPNEIGDNDNNMVGVRPVINLPTQSLMLE